METLPNEMLEIIVRKLSPRDLAHCSAVCRSWYKTMNQDWIWAPYCDPELEEPLQTIPSVATPYFEIPEAGKLPPISRWKWAFLREKHLWMNWRPEKEEQLKKEFLVELERNCLDVDFLSDTLIVVWYSNKIEILDASVTPAVIVAKTDVKVNIFDKFIVVRTDLLLVAKRESDTNEESDSDEESDSIKIFNVDITNKSITLKHHLNISNVVSYVGRIAKDNFCLFLNDRVKLKILDLSAGRVLQEETCPVKVNQHICTYVTAINCSPTSDFVAVEFTHLDSTDSGHHNEIFVYDLKQFKFLSGPGIKVNGCHQNVSLYDRWIAVLQTEKEGAKGSVTIYSISQTEGVLVSVEKISISDYGYHYGINLCNGCFIFVDKDFSEESSYQNVRIYSPSSKTLATIEIDVEPILSVSVINNKFISLTVGRNFEGSKTTLFKVLNQKVGKYDLEEVDSLNSFHRPFHKTNRSFTKGIRLLGKSSDHPNGWYIVHFW